MTDYESPFQLPKCNYNPKDIYRFDNHNPETMPVSHRNYDGCPVHRPSYEDYQDHRWTDWAMYRERFSKAIDEENADYFMARMLECVTDTIPPLAPEPVTRVVKTKKRPSDTQLALVCVIAVILTITCILAMFL